jgi:hypothetical protein
MPSATDAVSSYILAKDGNRPFLMRRAFAEDAELEMVVKTDAISFPGSASGLRAIEDVLVRRFGLDYENVFTFCLSRPSEHDRHFVCRWLVGMSAKSDGRVRVGGGRYDWRFADRGGLVEKLVITIDVMNTFPATELAPTMKWLSGLPYPWCTPEDAVKAMPRIEGLGAIEAYLRQVGPAPTAFASPARPLQ